MAVEQRPRMVSEIDPATVGTFSSGLRGAALRVGEEGFDDARKVWNGMIDRTPGLIVRPADVSDVQRAVDFAREHQLLVAVRGGGHNAAGLATCDGGLVIDLSAMNAMQVDPAKRRARAGGGTTWAVFDRATQEHGLATTGGAVSTTGVAGLTLGGGIGWLMRKYGLACDNLISAEVVTADGQVLTASADENPDLYWGLRGGGGNFGVVTSFEFQLHPLTTMLGGMLVHPAPRAPEVLRFYRDFTQSAPDELTVFAGLMTAPDGVQILGLVVNYLGSVEDGERAIRPLREFGPPVVDQVGPMPYVAQQSMLDEAFPSGLPVYWRSHFLSGLGDDVIDGIVGQFGQVTSPLSAILVEQMGGAVARVPDDATAFAHRGAPYNLALISRWTDPDAERHIGWIRGATDALQQFSSGGVYVNYLGIGEGQDRVRSAYGDAKYARLVDIKNRYDPTNLFRLNQNVSPTA
jgi:FAD/FMN-containing dehydrogenase